MKRSSIPLLGVGLRDGILVSIDDVERGLECNCQCPACGASLIAKKGPQRQDHFAHFSAADCGWGPESAAHLLAKEILATSRVLTVPPVYWEPATHCMLYPFKTFRFAHAFVEHRLDEIVPDIVLRTASGRELLVEMVVSHPAPPEKVHKIISLGTSAVEIYVPACEILNGEAVRKAVETTFGDKVWLYNARAEEFLRQVGSVNCDRVGRIYQRSWRYYGYFPVKVSE